MHSLAISGAALVALALAQPALANDAPAGAPPVVAEAGRVLASEARGAMRAEARRWLGGERAPGGWGGYRRPAYGFQLPGYWVSPSFFVGNWDAYGFGRPARGYGWSRYYDDAVLTDQWGRVYDTRHDVDWDRPGSRDHDGDRRGDNYSYRGGWDGEWRDGVYVGEWRGSVRPHWEQAHGGGHHGHHGGAHFTQGGYDYGWSERTVTTTVVHTAPSMVTTYHDGGTTKRPHTECVVRKGKLRRAC